MIEDGHVLDVPSSQRLDRAVNFYEKSAKRGNTDAMTDLGFLNEKGIIGNDQTSLSQAVEHYKHAIEGNNPRAMNNLAGLFLAGHIEESFEGQNEREAFKMYEKASALGSTQAITNLGICYLKGIHVEKDTLAAKKVNFYLIYNLSYLKKLLNKKNQMLYFI